MRDVITVDIFIIVIVVFVITSERDRRRGRIWQRFRSKNYCFCAANATDFCQNSSLGYYLNGFRFGSKETNLSTLIVSRLPNL